MTERKRDIYRAIMIAAANRRGLHLTAAECFDLSLDDAIATAAAWNLHNLDNLDRDFWRRQSSKVQPNPWDDPDRLR
jgi:hypothetical protein